MNDPLLELRGVTRRFGTTLAVDAITWKVSPGTVVGILGRNGAGKTTLLQCALGLLRCDQGEALVFGEQARKLSPAAKGRLSYVAQQPLLPPLPKVKNLCTTWAAFYPTWDQRLVDRLLDRFALPLETPVGKLSLGQMQSVALTLALGSGPELLVLDEPAAGLDPIARRHFLDAMIDVALDGERAVVLSTHLVTDLERIANRLMVMNRGRMVWEGELDELKSSVKRLRLVGGDLAKRPDWPEITAWQQDGDTALATVFGSVDELALRLHALLGTSVTVENIGLEDIVVEMHR